MKLKTAAESLFFESSTRRNRAPTDISHIAGIALSSSYSWKGPRQISPLKTSSSGLLYSAQLSGTTKTLFIFSRLPGLHTGYLKAPEKPPSCSLRPLSILVISKK